MNIKTLLFTLAQIVCCCLINTSTISAQESWLRIVYENIHHTGEDPVDLFCINNDLVVFSGGSFRTPDGSQSYRRLQRFDENGERVWTYNLEYEATGVGLGATLTKDSCTYLVTNSTLDSISGQYRPRVNKIDANGQLIWERFLWGDQFDDFWCISNGVTVSADSLGLIIIGRINAERTTMGRVEIDPEGNVLRYHTFEVPMIPDFSFIKRYTASVVSTSPGEVVIAYQNGQENSGEESFLLKLDSTGQILDTSYVGSRHVAQLHKLPNGDLILYTENEAADFSCGSSPDPPCNDGPHLYYYNTESLDSNWMVYQSTRLYNQEGNIAAYTSLGYAQDIVITNPGNIISLMEYSNEVFLLECHTPSGVLLWSRAVEIQEPYFPGSYDERYRALDISQAADGSLRIAGIIFLGHEDLTPFLGSYVNLMLMKLDSFGCAEPGCHLESGQFTVYTDVVEQEQKDKEEKWAFFPNPAQHLLKVQYTSKGVDHSGESVYFHLSNRSGQQFGTGSFIPREGLDVSSLPNGFYFLQLHTAQKKLKTIAFFKQ